MHDAPARRSHPQTTVAIAEHFQDAEPAPRSGELVYGFRSPTSQAHDRAGCGDQDSAILTIGHALHSSVWQAWHRIEFRRSGSPAPHPRLQSDPEIPLAVLMQPENAMADTAQLG